MYPDVQASLKSPQSRAVLEPASEPASSLKTGRLAGTAAAASAREPTGPGVVRGERLTSTGGANVLPQSVDFAIIDGVRILAARVELAEGHVDVAVARDGDVRELDVVDPSTSASSATRTSRRDRSSARSRSPRHRCR